MSSSTEHTAVGQTVRVIGFYTFCGRERHGDMCVVQQVHLYPPGVVDGDAIIEAIEYMGTYSDGSPAYGGPVPFLRKHLEGV